MSIDETYQKSLHIYIQQIQLNNYYPKVICQLVKSQNCQSWRILDEILQKIQVEDKPYFKQIIDLIDKNFKNVNTFTMLMFLFWFKESRRLTSFGWSWRENYNRICIENAQLTVYSTWVASEPNSKIVQESLQLIISIFPIYCQKNYLNITQIEMNAIMQWVCYSHCQNDHIYENICKLVKIARESTIFLTQDLVQKQHFILRKLIEVCCQFNKFSSNAFLFIYPFNLNEKDISYFCNLHSDFILDMSEQKIVNLFICLTKSAISPEIIYLVKKISLLLKNQEQFYKLRVVYQQFILPHLARRTKSCNKVQNQVYQACQYFVLGFLKHCDIGNNGMECLTKNIRKIRNTQMKEKWRILCTIVCSQYPRLTEYTEVLLSKELKTEIKLTVDGQQEKEIAQDPQLVWNVTSRSGKKLKKYPKFNSKIQGITNEQNQCYIISVVQALHKGKFLGKLISRQKNLLYTLKVLYELSYLFKELESKKSVTRISVRYLKDNGPLEFRYHITQEDAYQYLIKLFEHIQNEFSKAPKLLKQFKKIYEIQSSAVHICRQCNQSAQNKQFSYAITISHTEVLKQQTQQTISDYKCEKCGNDQTTLIRKLEPTSKILIVHINRFSHHNKRAKKELSTKTILRYFMQYRLVGMICHRGKDVEHGHYIYYHRLHSKRWVCMNDFFVQQFEVEFEDQEFEREWKQQLTPYILFYQQLDEQ